MEDETLKIGLLMEAAQAQQAMAETVLEKLKGQMNTLDDVVRGEIRHALVGMVSALAVPQCGQVRTESRIMARSSMTIPDGPVAL